MPKLGLSLFSGGNMLIGLHGKKRSGKDTAADYLVKTYGFEKIAFADGVRECLYALNPIVDCYQGARRYRDVIDKFGYEHSKDVFPDIRRLLQRMGTEVGRELIDDDLWVNLLFAKLNNQTNYIVSDVRFENEAKRILEYNGVVIHIQRDTGYVDPHISEQTLPESLITQQIENNNTIEELHLELSSVVRTYI